MPIQANSHFVPPALDLRGLPAPLLALRDLPAEGKSVETGPTYRHSARMLPQTLSIEERTIEVVATTETPVEMWTWSVGYCEEILVIREDTVDLGRVKRGRAPVLDAHNSWHNQSVIGRVVDAWIDPQGETGPEIRARLKMSDREEVEKGIWRDIVGGIVSNISIGYQVLRYETILEENKLPKLWAVKWELLEISWVPIGADPYAGARQRSLGGDGSPHVSRCLFVPRAAPKAPTPQSQPARSLTPVRRQPPLTPKRSTMKTHKRMLNRDTFRPKIVAILDGEGTSEEKANALMDAIEMDYDVFPKAEGMGAGEGESMATEEEKALLNQIQRALNRVEGIATRTYETVGALGKKVDAVALEADARAKEAKERQFEEDRAGGLHALYVSKEDAYADFTQEPKTYQRMVERARQSQGGGLVTRDGKPAHTAPPAPGNLSRLRTLQPSAKARAAAGERVDDAELSDQLAEAVIQFQHEAAARGESLTYEQALVRYRAQQKASAR